MLPGSELRSGMAVRVEGALHRIIGAEYHGGQGKMGGVMHAKLLNLKTGTMRERRFRADELVETVDPERQNMQFLYSDDDSSYFMHAETYEQLAIGKERLGRAASYLKEGMVLPVEFFEGQPTSVVFPDIVEIKVADTTPPVHTQGNDNVWKEARLENSVRIMVPPFIAPGESIRVEVATGKYVERARAEKKR
jgi:elongation factor P